ncbi:MAG: DUF3365 domain-containing protein [Planctomycetes bacterium]|nr:DUF3365 domain-containing protein [Planctomycetota bacterium]
MAIRKIMAGTLGLFFGIMLIWSATHPDASAAPPMDDARSSTKKTPEKSDPAIAKARKQAELMHSMYANTLDTMHHYYFHANRAVLPARAMEDIFSKMEKQTNVKARWIAINTKAMSVNHEPKSDFDKQAATAIAAGKGEFEQVQEGVYHRVGAIPLGSGCVNCHTGFFAKAPNTPLFAGLVISFPLAKD